MHRPGSEKYRILFFHQRVSSVVLPDCVAHEQRVQTNSFRPHISNKIIFLQYALAGNWCCCWFNVHLWSERVHALQRSNDDWGKAAWLEERLSKFDESHSSLHPPAFFFGQVGLLLILRSDDVTDVQCRLVDLLSTDIRCWLVLLFSAADIADVYVWLVDLFWTFDVTDVQSALHRTSTTLFGTDMSASDEISLSMVCLSK